MIGCFMPQTGMNEDNATYPSTRTISPSERTGGHFVGDPPTRHPRRAIRSALSLRTVCPKAGKPRLSASFVMTANRNAASNRAAARRCSRRGPPRVWSGPDALPVLRCGLLSRSAAGHLQATLNRTEWGLSHSGSPRPTSPGVLHHRWTEQRG